MKELSVEEKAKLYDKAIAHARLLLKTIGNATLGNLVLKNEFKTMFPVLEESEDEMIRNALITYHSSTGSIHALDKFTSKEICAWLEKQGEQKPEVKYVYTKFQIGDVIVEINPNGYCQPVTVKYVGEGSYSCESDDGKRSLSFPIIRQDEYKLVKQNPAWSEEDENGFSDALWCCKQAASIAKDENDMGNAWYAEHWLKSLKDRVQPQPKQEWSEEDENTLNDIIEDLNSLKQSNPSDISKGVYQEEIDWLKSLRPQNTWKPSDEQMDALRYVTNFDYGGHKATLVSLYEQLKKLKG